MPLPADEVLRIESLLIDNGVYDRLFDPYDDGTKYGSLMTDAIKIYQLGIAEGERRERETTLNLIKDLGFAMTCQSIGQYRDALSKAIRSMGESGGVN